MTFEEYLQIPRLSASDLKKIAKSALHYKWCKQAPQKATPAMELGKAIHCAILEPDRFKVDYICSPNFDRRTKQGKLDSEIYISENFGKAVIEKSMYDQAVSISNNVLSSPKIKSMLSNGECEQVFLYEIDGVLMKSCLDFVNDKIIVDVKTTKDASSSSFAKDCLNLGYDLQMALYQEAVYLTRGVRPHVIILAIEKEDEQDYCVYHMSNEWLELGLKKAKDLIAVYKECQSTGIYNGMPKTVQELVLPRWATNGN